METKGAISPAPTNTHTHTHSPLWTLSKPLTLLTNSLATLGAGGNLELPHKFVSSLNETLK